jgi:hypothetical protein
MRYEMFVTHLISWQQQFTIIVGSKKNKRAAWNFPLSGTFVYPEKPQKNDCETNSNHKYLHFSHDFSFRAQIFSSSPSLLPESGAGLLIKLWLRPEVIFSPLKNLREHSAEKKEENDNIALSHYCVVPTFVPSRHRISMRRIFHVS